MQDRRKIAFALPLTDRGAFAKNLKKSFCVHNFIDFIFLDVIPIGITNVTNNCRNYPRVTKLRKFLTHMTAILLPQNKAA